MNKKINIVAGIIIVLGLFLIISSYRKDNNETERVGKVKSFDSFSKEELKQKYAKNLVELNLWSSNGNGPLPVVTFSNKPYVFFYANNGFENQSYIEKYDFNADTIKNLDTGYLGRAQFSEKIFTDNMEVSPLGSYNEIMLLGFDGDKLVFWDHENGDTPGPCSDAWIDRADRLYYIVPNQYKGESLKKNKYIISEEQRLKKAKEKEGCMKNNE